MIEREWLFGDESVDELYKHKNQGIVKTYTGSFSSSVQDNIDRTRNKAGMIFSANFDRRKVNPPGGTSVCGHTGTCRLSGSTF